MWYFIRYREFMQAFFAGGKKITLRYSKIQNITFLYEKGKAGFSPAIRRENTG
jgi:hypothetical protein